MEYPKIETLFSRGEDFKVNPSEIKNPCYPLIKTWGWTEKIDGTNIRVIWNHLEGKMSVGGRTDNAQIPGDLVKYLYELVPSEKLKEVFPDASVTLYGEGYGAGIQKGGEYSPTKKFILFDVLVNEKWWLNWENVEDVGRKLVIDLVPFVGEMQIEEAAQIVKRGFQSNLNGGKMKAEGLVGRPKETLFDKDGKRMIVKLKTKDF